MSQVGHCDSTGNFSGKVLADLALKHGYGAYRIAAESEGRCGHARALVETLCKLMNGRMCGAVWRLGSAVGVSAACGHWVGASHVPSLDDWSEHEWFLKDGLSAWPAKVATTEEVLVQLDEAEKRRADFYVIVDLT